MKWDRILVEPCSIDLHKGSSLEEGEKKVHARMKPQAGRLEGYVSLELDL